MFLLLLTLLPFAQLQEDERQKVFCDVTGHPWDPIHGCKLRKQPGLYKHDWGMALIELVDGTPDGTVGPAKVYYACPDVSKGDERVVFCHTMAGLGIVPMRTPGCWRYGWKIEPSTACYNTTALSYYNYKGKRVPMKLVQDASPGIQMLLKHHMFQMNMAQRQQVGHIDHPLKRPSTFEFDVEWLPPPSTTTTTTSEPEPTESGSSEDDNLRAQLAIERADAVYYRFMLLFISFATAVGILGASHYIKYRTVVKAQKLYGPNATANNVPRGRPVQQLEERPTSAYIPPSSTGAPN